MHSRRSAIPDTRGMSCSTITRAAPSSWRRSVRTSPSASVSRWASPDDGSSSRSTRGPVGHRARQLDDAAGAGRQLGDEGVAVGAEPHSSSSSSTRAADGGLGAVGGGQRQGGWPAARGPRSWRSRARASVSETVSDGNSRAPWNDRPRPSAARAAGRDVGDVGAVEEDRAPRRRRRSRCTRRGAWSCRRRCSR